MSRNLIGRKARGCSDNVLTDISDAAAAKLDSLIGTITDYSIVRGTGVLVTLRTDAGQDWVLPFSVLKF